MDSIQLQFGSPGLRTIYKPTKDYYDYRVDNKLYLYYNSNYDTVPYEVVQIDGQQFIKYGSVINDTIKTLTSQGLIFTNGQGGFSKYFFSRQ